MLPLRDNIPSSKFPTVTVGIIVVNVLVFLHERQLGPHLEQMLDSYAIIPAHYTVPDIAREFTIYQQIFSFFSSMFLHGGWLHLLGNMWTLWIFGDNVEDRIGRANYIFLYFACGVAAGLMHVFTNATSQVPTIGASGAIAGIMGAYFRFYPGARVETLIPPFFIFPLPAALFLGWWFLLQFFNGAMSLGSSNQFSGIAWWAHVGGFAFGFAVCLLAKKEKPRRPEFIDI
jgi:membrane associated rhomboid family serine protease